MNVPPDLMYTSDHEWVRREGEGIVSVGITDHAQVALGDLVYVELPDVGRHVDEKEACAIVESVKAASDVYAPLAGEVTARNDELSGRPEWVNQDPYGAWLFKLRLDDEKAVDKLMPPADYAKSVEEA